MKDLKLGERCQFHDWRTGAVKCCRTIEPTIYLQVSGGLSTKADSFFAMVLMNAPIVAQAIFLNSS